VSAATSPGAPAPLVAVTMIREHLRDLPRWLLPEGFCLRAFRTGDRRTWMDLQRRSEPNITITDRHFDHDLGTNLPAMTRRCLFLVSPDGEDIGTITAWYLRSFHGQRWGRIHWVAIVPECRGRGLAKGMMTAAMNRLRELGHRRAMLVTHTVRTVAIRTYLNFGFIPDLSLPGAIEAWQSVRRELAHPALDPLPEVAKPN